MAEQAALLKTLKSNRTTIKKTCTRFRTYLTALNVPVTTIVELRQRLQRFIGLWDNFNEAQSGIEAIESADEFEQIHQNERELFEARYFEITVDLETLIERKEQEMRGNLAQHGSDSQQSRDGTPSMLSNNVANDHLKLPRVTMPTFSGKYEEWNPFRNIFLSMIHQNPTLPSTQKMQYLLSVLRGEAHDVVSSLETSDDNYSEAWKMLKERYDDDNLIIQKHIRVLFEQPVLHKENHVALRRMLDTVLKHVRALKAMKQPTDQWDDLLMYLVTSRLDQTTSKEWKTSIKKGDIPKFDQLTEFLAQRCRALEASSRSQRSATSTPHQGKWEHSKSTTAHVATTNVMCAFCGKEDHPIYKCNNFTKLEVDHRIKEARSRKLCLNCLKAASHQARQCGSGACRKCGKRHNTLLHLEQNSKNQAEIASASIMDTSGERSPASSVNLASVRQERQVLLATAIVNVLDFRSKATQYRALFDCGSQSCFVTTNCVQRLGLKQIPTNIQISGLGELSTQTPKIDCLVIQKITQALPANQLDLNELQIPDGITLADPEFNQPSAVDLLIGAEVFFELLCIGKIKLAEDQPIWQKTVLGWIVSGRFMMRDRSRKDTCCHLAINDELNASLSRFWQIEHNERQNTRTPEERFCEEHFAQTYKRDLEGRFIVTLPTRHEQLQELGDSRDIAL
ncbi:uncharacterized protein LOC115233265 [Formica exsecta]|uniref:uncharacterized protein LOC115233265 n=1 Tax=Formica exsecta TaxID=72781 RepID=UPI001141E4A9|nr:uncharacterized protein LOC115233265 [Formica exsecta]